MSRTTSRMNAALSLFMAFVLMLTCNVATFQPIAAYADDAVPQAGGGAVSLTKDYDGKDGYAQNLRSTFKLYRYPDGFTGEKVPVTVSTTDPDQFGPYTYDASSTLEKMREGTLNETTGGGTLTVDGLPEGDYGFEETSSSAGYAAYVGPRYFSVGSEAGG